jgi:hypothetical protein
MKVAGAPRLSLFIHPRHGKAKDGGGQESGKPAIGTSRLCFSSGMSIYCKASLERLPDDILRRVVAAWRAARQGTRKRD